METPIGKKYLYIAIVIGILALSYAAVASISIFRNSIDPTLSRSFQVQGEGKIVAIPDIAQFSLSVITEGGIDLAVLQKTNTEKINAINAFIKSRGVDDKDIKTESYSVEPRYQYYDCSPRPLPLQSSGAESAIAPEYYSGGTRTCLPPDIVGYNIHQSVSVKVRNFDEIGNLLSGVVEKGANSVSQLFFTLDDPTKPQNEARAEAIEKAKEKAKDIARAGGFRLGRLLSINEGGYYPTPYYALETAVGKGGGASVAPDIEPGSQDVTVTVTLVYEIK